MVAAAPMEGTERKEAARRPMISPEEATEEQRRPGGVLQSAAMSGQVFRLSHSKVQAFGTCRKLYWFRYVSGQPSPAPAPNAAGCVGTGIHRAMKALCETGEPADGAHELDAYLRMPAHECAGPGTDANRTAFELYEAGCAAHASIASEKRWAEIDTWAPWPSRGITVSARIDRADLLSGGGWQIIDWKTGAFEIDEVTDAQLDMGHIALRTSRRLANGEGVTAVAWNLRTGTRRVRVLQSDDARATMSLLANLAKRMQAEESFDAMPGTFCALCDWRSRCPEAEEVETRGWDAHAEED